METNLPTLICQSRTVNLPDGVAMYLWCPATIGHSPEVHCPGPMALGLDGARHYNAGANAHAEALGSSRPGPSPMEIPADPKK